MRFRNILAIAGVLCCAHVHAAEALAPVERPARIRLFGQNGIALTAYTNARCEDEYDEELEGSGSLSHAFRTLAGKQRPSQGIGIAQTEDSRNLAARDRLWANPYYLEYPLVPQQPLLLEAQISQGSGWRCTSNVRLSFIPQAGADYEGEMVREDGFCVLKVRAVSGDGQTSPVPAAPLPKTCASPADVTPGLMTVLFDEGQVRYRPAEAEADVEDIDDDEDSIKDFQEAIAELPVPAGLKVCIVSRDDAQAGPLASRLPALLAARGVQGDLLRASAEALEAQWQLTEERPLTFPLAEYYCRSAAGMQ